MKLVQNAIVWGLLLAGCHGGTTKPGDSDSDTGGLDSADTSDTAGP